MKDTIIRGREKIYVPGVEDKLIQYPNIANVAVVGMPDCRPEERPAAVIELASHAEHITVEELSSFLNDHGIPL